MNYDKIKLRRFYGGKLLEQILEPKGECHRTRIPRGNSLKYKNIIKLNTNENAFPPSPAGPGSNCRGRGRTSGNIPPPGADALAAAAAQDAGLLPENIFCANGSDEALALSFLAFFDPGKPVFTPDITYSFYSVWADLFDLTIKAGSLCGRILRYVRGKNGGRAGRRCTG